jgi:hypothetical protein
MYFGHISEDVLEMSDGSWEPFYDNYGNAYEFQLTIEEDQITLTDSIGRHVPIGLDAVASMSRAVKQAKKVAKAYTKLQDMQDTEVMFFL